MKSNRKPIEIERGWLNQKESAYYAGVDVKIMRQWWADGLEHVTIGGVKRTKREFIDEYMCRFLKSQNDDIMQKIEKSIRAM